MSYVSRGNVLERCVGTSDTVLFPATYVHGIEGDDVGTVRLATQEGSQVVAGEASELDRISQNIDLLGFAGTNGRFVDSGHPQGDVEILEPMGLIPSEDGGASWHPSSLQTESDLHTLSVATGGVIVGFDAQWPRSHDGQRWELANTQPFSLTGHLNVSASLLGTAEGMYRSEDAGARGAPIKDAPRLVIVGLDRGGVTANMAQDRTLYSSTDAGATYIRSDSADPGKDAVVS